MRIRKTTFGLYTCMSTHVCEQTCVSVQVCVSIHMCVCIHVWICIWIVRYLYQVFFSIALHLIFNTGSLSEPGAHQYSQDSWSVIIGVFSCLLNSVLQVQACATTSNFYKGIGWSNTGFYICVTSTFTNEPSPQLLQPFNLSNNLTNRSPQI